MKKTYSLLRMSAMMLLAVVATGLLFSCSSKDDEPEGGKNDKDGLNVYPWKDHPKSYIRLFDNRMDFQILSVVRNGPTVQVEYTLTNARFGKDVSINFCVDAVHDNLGNSFRCHINSDSPVLPYLDGKRLSDYFMESRSMVTFQPNQPVIGTITIRGFDKNATAFSASLKVAASTSSGIILGSDKFDFVNIPVPQ